MIHSPWLVAMPTSKVTEPAGRHPGDRAAEPLAMLATAKRLPTSLAGVGEVEVFDRDGVAAVSLCEPQQLGDRLPQPAVAGGGWLPLEV